MNALLHTLNIGTLATWLSVSGFGTVAVILPNHFLANAPRPEAMETQWIAQDFKLGGETSPTTEQAPSETSDPAETLPAPPDMPDLTAMEPLPEVPELPPTPAPAAMRDNPRPPVAATRPHATARTSRSTAGKSTTTGTSAAAGERPAGGTGMSAAARLAAGNMPSPNYPPEARNRGQTGTLVVEFTIDMSGRVISAYAISPSPWPLLNQEAVRTVRRWKFPPGGGVMKLQRPIIFQLR